MAAHEGRSPLDVSLTGPEQVAAPTTLTVVLRIERRIALNVPVNIRVRVPTGVRVRSGAIAESVTAGSQPDVVERSWQLDVLSIPSEDFVAEVDVNAADFGQHSVGRYRFGRPEPVTTALPRSSPPLRLNGHDFGQPVTADGLQR